MIPAPDDTPWWAWLLAVVLIAALTALASWWTQRPTRRAAEQAAASAAHAATELTPNHGSSTKDQAVATAAAVSELTSLVREVSVKLGEVDRRQGRIEQRQDELAASVGGIRDDARLERENHGRLEDRVTRLEQRRHAAG